MSLLFTPLRMRNLHLKNRIAVSPMSQFQCQEGIVGSWHRTHLGTLSQSGAGLVILEVAAVEAEGRISPNDLGLYSDAQEQALARLLAEVRQDSDVAIGMQIGHAGRKASTRPALDWCWDGRRMERAEQGAPLPPLEGGWEVYGPSALSYDAEHGFPTPIELDETGLARVHSAFGQAAARAARAGMDFIEVHAAHGYLLHSFVSPQSNIRQDRFGGSRDARLRFPLMVAEAVRSAFPADKPVGFRINGEDWIEGGVTLDDAIYYAQQLRNRGIDYVVLSAGNNVPGVKLPPLTPGYMVHFAERVKREVGILTMAVGLILDGPQAEAILQEGRADIVAVGRGFIDDPKWGWHAAYALGESVDNVGLQARVHPRRWPGYHHLHALRGA
jgi:2,4-dienoyl-CoA reductase-like NADH-dependent reductase (Old Yellow Enzyme family)